MDLIPQLLMQVGGGVLAAIADRQLADKQVTVGPITLSAGALGAVGAAIAVASGVRFPGRAILANLAGGALVYEGTKLGEQQIVPLVEKMFPSLGAAPAAVTAGEDYVAGYLSNALPSPWEAGDDYDLSQSLSAFRA